MHSLGLKFFLFSPFLIWLILLVLPYINEKFVLCKDNLWYGYFGLILMITYETFTEYYLGRHRYLFIYFFYNLLSILYKNNKNLNVTNTIQLFMLFKMQQEMGAIC